MNGFSLSYQFGFRFSRIATLGSWLSTSQAPVPRRCRPRIEATLRFLGNMSGWNENPSSGSKGANG